MLSAFSFVIKAALDMVNYSGISATNTKAKAHKTSIFQTQSYLEVMKSIFELISKMDRILPIIIKKLCHVIAY